MMEKFYIECPANYLWDDKTCECPLGQKCNVWCVIDPKHLFMYMHCYRKVQRRRWLVWTHLITHQNVIQDSSTMSIFTTVSVRNILPHMKVASFLITNCVNVFVWLQLSATDSWTLIRTHAFILKLCLNPSESLFWDDEVFLPKSISFVDDMKP